MTASRITGADLAALVERMGEAADAYIRGDVHHYFSLFEHPDDYTLMPPYGGETWHGFTLTEEGAAETARYFASGEARLDVQASYVSGDLAVLVAVERQHGEVGGRPTRTGRCGSPWCSGAPATAGSWCTGTRTRWCGRSPSSTSRAWPGARSERQGRPGPRAGSTRAPCGVDPGPVRGRPGPRAGSSRAVRRARSTGRRTPLTELAHP